MFPNRHHKKIPQSRQGQRFYMKALAANPYFNAGFDRFFIPAQNLGMIYDDRLPRSAIKVMSHVISRQRKSQVFIDDENQYIANVLKLSYSSVQKALQLLEWCGYICRSIKRDPKNVKNVERKIYIVHDWKPKSEAYNKTIINQKAEKELDAKVEAVRTQRKYAELDVSGGFEQLRAELQQKPAPAFERKRRTAPA